MQDVEIPAICDINVANLNHAQALVEQSGRKRPEGYSLGEEDFRRLVLRDDLDAVIIATPWKWHTPISVAAMKAGKYVGVEVPAALTVAECWELVKTSESTPMPCEVVHCHCAHTHNCVDHWFFTDEGQMRWSGEYLVTHNGSHYTTHALGPVLSWMDINCGDRFASLTSVATRSLGINHQLARNSRPGIPT